jgi:hypothetical protein
VERKIRSNKNWLKNIEQRADRYQMPLDSAIVHEANFAITHDIEAFLPAFKDSIPTKRSSEARRHKTLIDN